MSHKHYILSYQPPEDELFVEGVFHSFEEVQSRVASWNDEEDMVEVGEMEPGDGEDRSWPIYFDGNKDRPGRLVLEVCSG